MAELVPAPDRRCTRCGGLLVELGWRIDRRKGRNPRIVSQCRPCVLLGSKESKQRHRAARKAYNTAYNAAHRDKRRQYFRDYVSRHPERERERQAAWRAANKEKVAAYGAVQQALITGQLVRPTVCTSCGSLARTDAHHADYAKPLEVQWLCRTCHNRTHAARDAEKHARRFGGAA